MEKEEIQRIAIAKTGNDVLEECTQRLSLNRDLNINDRTFETRDSQ